ncbi:hypothetical protein GCM10027592_43250 [Spirosoma flavus]
MWEEFKRLFLLYPLDFISQILGLLPILVGLCYSKRLTLAMKWVVIFFFTLFIKDCIALVYSLNIKSNLYLYNLQSFFEIGIVAVIYALNLPKRALFILIASVLTLIINTFFYSSQELSAGNLSIARLFILVIVLIYLSHVLNEAVIQNIMRHNLFWISAGFLIYATGTFFVFLSGKYLFDKNTSDETFNFYWGLQEIIYIIFCLLAAYGLWLSKYDRENLA